VTVVAGAALFLVAVAAVGCLAGPVIMARPWWLYQPRPAAALLIVASASSVVGLAAAGLALMAVLPGPAHERFERAFSCLPAHSHPADVVGLITVALLLAWAGLAALRGVVRVLTVRSARRRHRAGLHLVAAGLNDHPDAVVVPHPARMVYSLPGPPGGIVISDGALNDLGSQEFEAVLAHERAHLRQRHHAVILLTEVLAIVLPALPTLRIARRAVPLLLEMVADDAAARAVGSQTVASALERMADARVPPESAAAAGIRRSAYLRAARMRDLDGAMPSRGGFGHLLPALAASSTVAATLIGPLAAATFLLSC
jgi:Zn-dependent protease with chaperone function